MSTIAEITADLLRGESVYKEMTDQWLQELKMGCSCQPKSYECLGLLIDALQIATDTELVPSDITEANYKCMLLIIGSAIVKIPPSVNAGVDKTTQANQSVDFNAVAIQGSAPITGYLWTKLSGASVLMTGTTTSQLTVSGLSGDMPIGNYEFKVVVTDSNGLTGFDTVKLTVTANNVIVRFGFSSTPIDLATFNYQYTKSVPAGATNYELEFPVDVLTGDKYIAIDEPQAEPSKGFWFNTSLNRGSMGDFTLNTGVIVAAKRAYKSTGIFVFDGTNRKLKLSVNEL